MRELYNYKTAAIPANIKDVDGKKGIVTGYFSAFGNVDASGDIIKNGAFTKSINEWGPQSTQPRIKHLFNHNTSQPLGKLLTLTEDATGLRYDSQIGSHGLGLDFIKMIESELITEHSIGYEVMKSNQLQSWDDYKANPTGGHYELTDLRLWEGSSLSAWGCNSRTPLVGMKDGTTFLEDLIKHQKNIEKFCRNTTATDDTIELVLLENKQLIQIIFDLSKTATQQSKNDTPQEDEWVKGLSLLTNNLTN